MNIGGAYGESGCFDDDACGDAGSLDCVKELCNIATSSSTKKLILLTFTSPAHVDVSPQLRGCETDESTDGCSRYGWCGSELDHGSDSC